MAWAVPSRSGLCLVALSLLARPTGAEPIVPPGFGVHVYVTGDGFEASPGGGARGVRSTSTLAFDETGALYLARTGRRYAGGEGEELWPLYRIPRGGARLTPPTEAQFYYGPPLLNAQVAAMRAGRELFVTTFDRDRKVGVVYRMRDGRAELFAGGTPPDGTPPLLVPDRQGARIFFLDGDGKPVEFASFTNGDAPRSLAFAPITPETRGAGIAGDLFVVTTNRGAWQVNEVLRISGPFDAHLRGR